MVYTFLIQCYIIDLNLDVYVMFIIILLGTIILSLATSELIAWLNSQLKRILRKHVKTIDLSPQTIP